MTTSPLDGKSPPRAQIVQNPSESVLSNHQDRVQPCPLKPFASSGPWRSDGLRWLECGKNGLKENIKGGRNQKTRFENRSVRGTGDLDLRGRGSIGGWDYEEQGSYWVCRAQARKPVERTNSANRAVSGKSIIQNPPIPIHFYFQIPFMDFIVFQFPHNGGAEASSHSMGLFRNGVNFAP